jgi:hypothetical protein
MTPLPASGGAASTSALRFAARSSARLPPPPRPSERSQPPMPPPLLPLLPPVERAGVQRVSCGRLRRKVRNQTCLWLAGFAARRATQLRCRQRRVTCGAGDNSQAGLSRARRLAAAPDVPAMQQWRLRPVACHVRGHCSSCTHTSTRATRAPPLAASLYSRSAACGRVPSSSGAAWRLRRSIARCGGEAKDAPPRSGGRAPRLRARRAPSQVQASRGRALLWREPTRVASTEVA